MKAKIVSQMAYQQGVAYEGARDFIHEGVYPIQRLVVKVKKVGQLVITPHGNQVYVFIGFDLKKGCKILGKVEVPDKLVKKALAFVSAKAKFDGLGDTFRALLG